MLICDVTTRGWGWSHLKGLEGTVSGAHRQLAMTPVPSTSQSRKPHHSVGIGHIKKYLSLTLGIISPRLNVALILINES